MMTVVVREKSLAESRTHRGLERRWVEPLDVVVVGRRTRLFTETEWHGLFPPPWERGRNQSTHEY